MADSIWYREGVVTVANGSAAIYGTGTFFLTHVRPGDVFSVDHGEAVDKLYEITKVLNDAQITITPAYEGETETDANYSIIRNFTGAWSIPADLARQIQDLVYKFRTALQNNLKGDTGETGEAGKTILGGHGAPGAGIGTEGDWYLDMDTWNIYRREGITWILRGELKGVKGDPGQNGSRIYTEATLSDSVGDIGDYNFNADTGDFHKRALTGWVFLVNLKGPQGNPGQQGIPGEIGLTGASSDWLTGSAMPASTTGTNEDMFLNLTNGDIYKKVSNIWTLKGNIKGRVGDTGVPGPRGMTWRGEWNADTQYAQHDAVRYIGNTWIAAAVNIGAPPPVTAASEGNGTWLLFVPRGADGTGIGDMLKEVYDPQDTGTVLSALEAEHAGRADSAATAASVLWEGVIEPPEATRARKGLAQFATDEEFADGEANDKMPSVKQVAGKIVEIQSSLMGLSSKGGALTAHDFGTNAPTQEQLTEYAAEQIWGAGGTFIWNSETPSASTYTEPDEESTHTADEIFNSTWVRNMNDGGDWQITNTPGAEPPVFEWINMGTNAALPKGGLAGQVLAKNSQADYDAKWIPAPIGGEGNIDLSEIYAQLAILKSLMNVTDIIVGDSAIAEQARNWDTYFVGILEDVSAGAASILVPAGNALYPFSEYTLISPEAVEAVQIDSVELINGNIKVNLAAPLENGYPAQSLLARSTLGISGVAGASPGQMKQTNTWFVNETWTGTSNTVPNTVPLDVSLGQSSSYDMDAAIQIQVGGLISLQAS